ncbi:MAG: ankyrin repeat domain-containing protein [candidate division Zixibacteria bacterium]|nr:ankyrin repeat domain-containing protein [candidate division Zixibacteria bacterium]
MKRFRIILILLLPLCLCTESCGQGENRYVAYFKDTPAYNLAKAIKKNDLEKVEILIKQDSTLLQLTEPEFGNSVLALAVNVESFESFEKLLELGADANSMNPFTNYSVLMTSIRPFGSSLEWRDDNRYAELLLQNGADPEYAVEKFFIGEKRRVWPDSPLMKASRSNLEMVKILIKYGADPFRKLGQEQQTPFGAALSRSRYDIIYYFIDTLEVDIHQPLSIRNKDSLFIQDYIVKKKILAKIRAREVNGKDIQITKESWELIKYLESKGVDFVNYEYKRLK